MGTDKAVEWVHTSSCKHNTSNESDLTCLDDNLLWSLDTVKCTNHMTFLDFHMEYIIEKVTKKTSMSF